MSDIKAEFEKALMDYQLANTKIPDGGPIITSLSRKDIALWAARWAMERCADEAEQRLVESHPVVNDIRKLAKELSNGQ